MQLEGEKTYLRPVIREDLEAFVRWLADPDVTRHTQGRPYTMEEEIEWFETIQKDPENFVFSILLKDNDELIGNCAVILSGKELEPKCKVSVGIMLGEKCEWGKGYGTDALKTLLKYIQKEYQPVEVYLSVDTVNQRAIRCYEKCGFEIVEKGNNPKRVNSNGEEYVMKIVF